MAKIFGFTISIIFYLIGVGGLFYFIGWIGNLLPWHPFEREVEMSTSRAILTNLLLISICALQHSIMARKSFKKWWTSLIPKYLERSTYVLISGLLCILIAWQWAPIDGVIWELGIGSAGATVMKALYFIGIAFLLSSSFLINHFELFGLQQAYHHMMGKERKPSKFVEIFYYRVVRHPIYLGFLLIIWPTAHMTATHLALALGFTAYIYLGIYFEEKDLVAEFGDVYRLYRKRVPGLIPFTKLLAKKETTDPESTNPIHIT